MNPISDHYYFKKRNDVRRTSAIASLMIVAMSCTGMAQSNDANAGQTAGVIDGEIPIDAGAASHAGRAAEGQLPCTKEKRHSAVARVKGSGVKKVYVDNADWDPAPNGDTGGSSRTGTMRRAPTENHP